MKIKVLFQRFSLSVVLCECSTSFYGKIVERQLYAPDGAFTIYEASVECHTTLCDRVQIWNVGRGRHFCS